MVEKGLIRDNGWLWFGSVTDSLMVSVCGVWTHRPPSVFRQKSPVSRLTNALKLGMSFDRAVINNFYLHRWNHFSESLQACGHIFSSLFITSHQSQTQLSHVFYMVSAYLVK